MRSPSAWVAAVALAGVLGLAGCGSPDTATHTGGGEPTAAPQRDPTRASPLDLPVPEAWVLSDCQVAQFNAVEDRRSAAEGLPPDHVPRGDIASRVLLAVQCGALARGNHTVHRPFSWAVTTTPLEVMGDGGQDAYVREIVASDATVALALQATGFPAVHGSVAVEPTASGLHAVVAADGLAYDVQSPVAAPQDTFGPSSILRLRGAEGTRWFWMEAAIERSAYGLVDAPAAAQVDGGALSGVAVGGLVAGQMAGSSETWSVAFVAADSG